MERFTSSLIRWTSIGTSLKPSLQGAFTQVKEVNPEINTVDRKGRQVTKLWVLVVLVVGVAMGILLSLFIQVEEFEHFRFEIEPVLTFYIVLSTISLAMLISLLVVYSKVYVETKANFALGLVIVLGALLLHSLLSNPILLILLAPIPFGLRPFLSIADVFTVVAYTVFLYLSLE